MIEDIAELRKKAEQLNFALENSHIDVWDWNISTDEVFYDYSYVQTQKQNEEHEQISTRQDWKSQIHPDDLDMAMELLNAHIEGLTPYYEAEYRVKTPEDTWKWILDRGKVVQWDGKGNSLRAIGTHQDVTKRKETELALTESLNEKNILLKEIHHRVKNNLQIISGLSILHEQYIQDEKTLKLFKDFQNRIKAMAKIHETIYKSDNLSKISSVEYIEGILSNLVKTYRMSSDRLKVSLNIDSLGLEINKAIHIGLIINELVSNAFKYAFPNIDQLSQKLAKLKIEFIEVDENYIRIVVEDNGIGFPEGFNFDTPKSLGMKIVKTSVRQLRGTINIDNYEGAKVTILLPKSIVLQ